MNERTTLEKIAPTVDEAILEGLTELGLAAEFVNVEVLDKGSHGLFGVGSRQARVRLTVKMDSSEAETTRAKGSSRTDGVVPVPEQDLDASEEVSEEAFRVLDDNILFISRQTVAELLEKMNIPAHIEVRYGEPDEEGQRPVLVDVQGEDLGVLIGRRAEILNALQYIVNLIVSKQVEHWVQVIIDVQGYRVRHERQLRQIAQRMADQAMKAGRRQILNRCLPVIAALFTWNCGTIRVLPLSLWEKSQHVRSRSYQKSDSFLLRIEVNPNCINYLRYLRLIFLYQFKKMFKNNIVQHFLTLSH